MKISHNSRKKNRMPNTQKLKDYLTRFFNDFLEPVLAVLLLVYILAAQLLLVIIFPSKIAYH